MTDTYFLVEEFPSAGNDRDVRQVDFDSIIEAQKYFENSECGDVALYRVVNGNREFLA